MTSEPSSSAHSAANARHYTVAIVCAAIVAGMVGLSYAAVPLYQIFCRTTGFGGTTQVAIAPSDKVLDRTIMMRFDANISKDLKWKFEPVQNKFEMRIGENRIAKFRATNISDKTTTGTASFNVSPEAAGAFFNKIQCFCFTEQTLKPGETVEMPVTFYVDPDIVNDPDAGHLTELTLSYTFYPVKKAEHAGVSGDAEKAGG